MSYRKVQRLRSKPNLPWYMKKTGMPKVQDFAAIGAIKRSDEFSLPCYVCQHCGNIASWIGTKGGVVAFATNNNISQHFYQFHPEIIALAVLRQ